MPTGNNSLLYIAPLPLGVRYTVPPQIYSGPCLVCRIFFGTLFPRIVDDAYRNKNEAEVSPHDRAGRANPFCLRHPLFTAAKMLQRGWVRRILQDEDLRVAGCCPYCQSRNTFVAPLCRCELFHVSGGPRHCRVVSGITGMQ